MKNQVSKSKSLFLSLLLIIGISFSLSAQEVKKEVSESFKATKDFALGIDNKYGSIEIVNWDKSQVDVLVEIIVKSSSEDKAQKILDQIEIDVNKGGNSADFTTEIDLKSMNGKNSIEVNYKVSAPASINADLTQKYGNVFVESLTGNANFVIKYGTLKVQSLVNAKGIANDLALGYSNATIKTAGKINAKLAYSEIKFGEVGSYEGKLAYGSFSAALLTGNLELDAAYSGVEVEKLSAAFENVNITSAYGDVKLAADPGAKFSYHLETKFGSLNAPHGAKRIGEKANGHGPDLTKTVEGSVGNSSASKITVSAKYGNISLK